MLDYTSDQTRISALARYDLSDPLLREAFDRFERIAAHGLRFERSHITFIGSDCQWLKNDGDCKRDWLAPSNAFCLHVVQLQLSGDEPGILVVPDASADPAFASDAYVVNPPHVRFFAGAPIITPDGFRIGSVCVFSSRPHHQFSQDDKAFLTAISGSISAELERSIIRHRQEVQADEMSDWNALSMSLAAADDFNTTLDLALQSCVKRHKAVASSFVQYHPESDFIEFVKTAVSDDSSLVGDDFAFLFGQYPTSTFSFGPDIAVGRSFDSGDLRVGHLIKDFPRVQRIVDMGIVRQVTLPFSLGSRKMGLVVVFSDLEQSPSLFTDLYVFISRFAPHLSGRLRESEIDRANRALRTISAINASFSDAKTKPPQSLYEDLCRIAVDVGGYKECYVALPIYTEDKPILIVANAGDGDAYTKGLTLSWDDVPNGRGPTGTAIRTGEVSRFNDLSNDVRFSIWRDRAGSFNFHSCISFPFGPFNGNSFGAFTLYSSNPMAFAAEEQGLLSEVVSKLNSALNEISMARQLVQAEIIQMDNSRRIDHLLQASGVVLYSLEFADDTFSHIEVSDNFYGLSGYSSTQAMKQEWWEEHVHADDLKSFFASFSDLLEKEVLISRYRIRHANGHYIYIRDEMYLQKDSQGNRRSIVGVLTDVTERKSSEEEIHRLAYSDPLTGLPNRRLITEKIGQFLRESMRTQTSGALFFLDLNQFKIINDTLGHDAGDHVLREVGNRFSKRLRDGDLIGRMGGDEFVALIGGIKGHANVEEVARGIARNISDAISSEPIIVEAREYYVGSTIGFTIFPKHGDTVESIVREADTAMYRAKEAKIGVLMFSTQMFAMVSARHEIEEEMRFALQNDGFEVWLQPQVDSSSKIVGAEALVRLRSRNGKLIPPMDFIGIAEESGLILKIGRIVLKKSLAFLNKVHEADPDWRMSVNISSLQFEDPLFVSQLASDIAISGAPGNRLTLEITESLLVKDVASIAEQMHQLESLGVRFSIDDFGMGFSNLANIHNLPIHELKIDKSFISNIPQNKSSVVIVDAVLTMAKSLNLDVVVEGVETDEHASFLFSRGCKLMQGYFYGRPQPMGDFEALFFPV